MRRRTVIAAALLAVVAASACGSTVADKAVGGSTGVALGDGALGPSSGGPVIPGAQGAGIASSRTFPRASANGSTAGSVVATRRTRVTASIQIGFLNTKVGNGEAAGLNIGQTYPPRQIFEALVAAMNKRGGLAGRRIVPVISDTDTATATWETDYQAACANFTQDHRVSAVLGYSFVLIDSFEKCLTNAGVAHLNGGYNVGDKKTLADYPALFATTNPTADRRYRLQLEAPLRAGFLTKTSRLGLVLDDCPYSARAYDRTLAPYIKSARINVAATAVLSCANGASDVSGIVAQINAAVLRFRSSNVDRVFIEGIPFIFFANNAESQGYRPGYLLTSTTGGRVLAANSVPEAQLRNIRAYGWLPVVDVGEGAQPKPTMPQNRCLALLRENGITPSQYNDYLSAYTTCDAMFLYEKALNRTRGASSASIVRSAIEAMGTSYASPSAQNAVATYGPGRHEAPTLYRPWSLQATCSCFKYTGPAQRF